MKRKNLNKRIRRLEARLQKGAKKLAKLKQQQEEKRRATPQPGMEPAGAKEPSVAKKAKRKLNLTPERRAQLAAAMKARWAAKRAAAHPQNSSADPGLTPGDLSQPR